MKPRRPPRWWAILVGVVTVALVAVLVGWADGEYRRVFPNLGDPEVDGMVRPDWVWRLRGPFQRTLNAVEWVAGAATLGVGLLLGGAGRLRPRRGRMGPAARTVLVVLILGGFAICHTLLTAQDFSRSNGVAFGLHNVATVTMPGVVIGSWVVGRRASRRWRRDPLERLARVVPLLWLAEPLLMAVGGVVFG